MRMSTTLVVVALLLAPRAARAGACTADACTASGGCEHTAMPGAPCPDDGSLCTNDACTADGVCRHEAAPDPDCKAPVAPRRARLVLKKGARRRRDALSWIWARGAATAKQEFGDPTTTTDYALCAYAGAGTAAGLLFDAAVPAGGRCGRKACWKAGARDFAYRNRAATPGGLRNVVLRDGRQNGLARIGVSGGGEHLALPDLALPAGTPLTVQLRNDAGACWGAAYSHGVRSRSNLLRAKSD